MNLVKHSEVKLEVVGYEKKDGIFGTYFFVDNVGEPLHNEITEKDISTFIIHVTCGVSQPSEYEVYDKDDLTKMIDIMDIPEIRVFFDGEGAFYKAIRVELEEFCRQEMIPYEFMDDDYDMGFPLFLHDITEAYNEGKLNGEFLTKYRYEGFKWEVDPYKNIIRIYDNSVVEDVVVKLEEDGHTESIIQAYDKYVAKWNKLIVGKYDFKKRVK